MRVLNVNAVLDPVAGGGTAERTIQISRSLITEGIDCCIMTTDLGFTNGVLPGLEGIETYSYKCMLNRFYVPHARYSRIKKVVDSVDIVHLMGHWTILNALVYIAARKLGKLYVVCPAGALPIFGRSKIIKKLYNWIIGYKIIKNADAWIAITKDEKNQFKPYNIAADKITTIPNGVNQNDFPKEGASDFREKYNLDSNKFILFLGRLNVIKGPDLLLEAFCKGADIWGNWHLVYAGPDGGLLEQLKKDVVDCKLCERIHFIGYVGGMEKSAAYHAADLLVIPSRQEAMSIVVLEAGISSTPVILTDKCGFDEVESIDGGKVSPATIDGIYENLQFILDEQRDLSCMGRNLKRLIKNNYTWSVIIKKYINLYEKLINV